MKVKSIVSMVFATIGLMLVLALVGGLLGALFVWLLWDYVAPFLRLPQGIGFWQAWALFVICRVLFSPMTASKS